MKSLAVCCIKQGVRYGAEYVNTLYRMVERNLSVPHDFVCFTDNPEGIDPAVTILPPLCDEAGWWGKMYLYQDKVHGLKGVRRILFLDLDVVITGRLDDVVTYKTDHAMIRDYPDGYYPAGDIRQSHGNSSVILLTVGKRTEIWDAYRKAGEPKHGSQQGWINQRFLSGLDLFPDWMMKSYKMHNLQNAVPENCRVVMFHGIPKPPDCGGWVRDYWQ